MYQCSTWIYGQLARTPKYRYTNATKKIAIVPLQRGVRLIWLNSSKGGKILIHFFHNHVRNKVKSPHPHTTIKWVTAASHAPPPARSGMGPSATASAAAHGSLPHVPVQ